MASVNSANTNALSFLVCHRPAYKRRKFKMLLPETYPAALCLMILTMICWGSWANTLKICPGYRFQLFYWDYAIGVVLGALLLGMTAGSHGSAGPPFFSDIVQTPLESMKMAALGGVVFNIANLLLVAAID